MVCPDANLGVQSQMGIVGVIISCSRTTRRVYRGSQVCYCILNRLRDKLDEERRKERNAMNPWEMGRRDGGNDGDD